MKKTKPNDGTLIITNQVRKSKPNDGTLLFNTFQRTYRTLDTLDEVMLFYVKRSNNGLVDQMEKLCIWI